jgi:hypothetical protein
MLESDFMRQIMLLATQAGARVFRNNVGSAWQGKKSRRGNTVIVDNATLVKYGLCVGSSDLIGWIPVTVTPDMVGQKIAVFTAIETKGHKTGITPEQVNFLSQVANGGGIAILSRESHDTERILRQAGRGEGIGGTIHGPMPRTRRQGE